MIKSKPIRLAIKPPETDREKAAVEMWRRATPAQRLELFCEMHKFGLILTGQIKPWETETFK